MFRLWVVGDGGLGLSLHPLPIPAAYVGQSQMTWGGGPDSLGERGQIEHWAADGSPCASVTCKVLGTGMLMVGLLAILDTRNKGVPAGLEPVAVGLLILTIGLSMGANCGFPLNPARDLGPRLFTYVAGWGPEVFRWAMASPGAVPPFTTPCSGRCLWVPSSLLLASWDCPLSPSSPFLPDSLSPLPPFHGNSKI